MRYGGAAQRTTAVGARYSRSHFVAMYLSEATMATVVAAENRQLYFCAYSLTIRISLSVVTITVSFHIIFSSHHRSHSRTYTRTQTVCLVIAGTPTRPSEPASSMPTLYPRCHWHRPQTGGIRFHRCAPPPQPCRAAPCTRFSGARPTANRFDSTRLDSTRFDSEQRRSTVRKCFFIPVHPFHFHFTSCTLSLPHHLHLAILSLFLSHPTRQFRLFSLFNSLIVTSPFLPFFFASFSSFNFSSSFPHLHIYPTLASLSF